MGELRFPPSSRIYLDTAPIIYSVERIPNYWPLMHTLWQTAAADSIQIFTSELALLETLVMPIRQNSQTLITTYETLLTKTDITLCPITTDILRASAALRATQNFKTPDAIHSATALAANCDYIVANDAGFRRLANIGVVILSDLLRSWMNLFAAGFKPEPVR